MSPILLFSAPVDSGKRRVGCRMGPDALHCAELAGALSDLGHDLRDCGRITPDPIAERASAPAGGDLHALTDTVGWTRALSRRAREAAREGIPVFLGGDHSLSLGSVHGIAEAAAERGRRLFLLWLDAHSDFHTPATTTSGHLHGMPVAYATGQPGFEAFPPVAHPIAPEDVCLVGLRSVDPAERAALAASGIRRHDMRAIDERGIAACLAPFLEDIARANGILHVSLDVDFLDPAVAPAVGTTVPGGATIREAHLAMEMIHDSRLMRSMDLVELNPMLDEGGRTAQTMVDLCASAFGRRVFDRPTPGRL